MNSTEEKNQ